eukprot:CAMPEP_0170648532 /NCGR_PEP_ID=MMETSP0224-20130122/44786_1 /TAXON_ID=285029 /ORGANISM="Togula jolla, Strain CCCM 725" /LENGTH=480 /DNA_ID=CAMNT_0010980067 /DNA_START=325 /DNA_END=1767 /DNA_ORIENTATION=+
MDRLAAEGLTFSRAYANYAWCAPSRNSFLSGRRPDTTKDFNFLDDFRKPGIGDKWRSLPEYFKEHGYTTANSGKVFHKMVPANNDYPRSWSMKPFTPLCHPPDCPDSTANFNSHALRHADCIERSSEESTAGYCALNISKDEDDIEHQLEDQAVTDNCIRYLKRSNDLGKPFFVACGFHKPHMPWIFPAEFLAHYPPKEEIPLAKHPQVPLDSPMEAWHQPPKEVLDISTGYNDTHDPDIARGFRRAYYACVSYIDYNVGKILKTLDKLGRKDDTLVVLMGDHGFHLGEQNIWAKMTNFELGLRVPLIVRAPWLSKSVGKVTPVLAELVDLYPTLTELAGLPDPKSKGEALNGTSLAPVFEDPMNISLKKFALGQFAKPHLGQPWKVSAITKLEDINIMGYTIRTDRWRYTAWFRFDGIRQVPLIEEELSNELYDHAEDDGQMDSSCEAKNMVHHDKWRSVVEDLDKRLKHLIRLYPISK